MKIDNRVLLFGGLALLLGLRGKKKADEPDPEPPEPDPDPVCRAEDGCVLPPEPEPDPDPEPCEPCDIADFDPFLADVVIEVIDQQQAAEEAGLLLTNAERDGEIADFYEARKAVNPLLGRRISYPEWLAAASFWHVMGVPESVTECCVLTGQWETLRRQIVGDAQAFIGEGYWTDLLERALVVGDPEPTMASLRGPVEAGPIANA